MKLLVIVEKSQAEKYRTRRIIEEVKERKWEAKVVTSDKVTILADSVLYEGEKINFEEFHAIYSVGNSAYHYYMIVLASTIVDIPMWPSKKHVEINDKFYGGILMDSIGIPTPKTILLNSRKKKNINLLVEELGGYPCIIKKVTGSAGDYVELVNSQEEIKSFLMSLPHPSIMGKKNILLQEYIKESKGTDFRVYCVGEKILGAIKRTASDDNFKANVSLGGTAEQVDLTDEMIEYSKKIMKEGKLLFAGIDFIKSQRGYLAIEINTSADFEGFEKATKLNVAGEIVDAFISESSSKNRK